MFYELVPEIILIYADKDFQVIACYFHSTEAACTEVDEDRWNPDYGGCCLGLTAKKEARPTSMTNYCPSNDTNHGKNCWSTIVICRGKHLS